MKKARTIVALVAMLLCLALPNYAAAYTEEECMQILDDVVEEFSSSDLRAELLTSPEIADFKVTHKGKVLNMRIIFSKEMEFNLIELDRDIKMGMMDDICKSCKDNIAEDKEFVELLKELGVNICLTIEDSYGNDISRQINSRDL